MNPYFEKNNNALDSRLQAIIKNKEVRLKRAMYQVMDSAMTQALELHDNAHSQHVQFGKTYGWMLVHDGAVVRIKTNSGQDKSGKVDGQLRAEVPSLPVTGWVGVLMASMNTEDGGEIQSARYYSVRFETDILEQVISEVDKDFRSVFTNMKFTR